MATLMEIQGATGICCGANFTGTCRCGIFAMAPWRPSEGFTFSQHQGKFRGLRAPAVARISLGLVAAEFLLWPLGSHAGVSHMATPMEIQGAAGTSCSANFNRTCRCGIFDMAPGRASGVFPYGNPNGNSGGYGHVLWGEFR